MFHDIVNILFWKVLDTVKLLEYKILKLDEIIFVNNQLDAQFFFIYVYFYSLYVSGSHVPIIRRINCINTTSGILAKEITLKATNLNKLYLST